MLRIWHIRTASTYVVVTNWFVPHSPAMQSLLEPDAPPVRLIRRRQVLPSQHCAAIGSLWMGSCVAVALVTQMPEPSVSSPWSTQTPSLGNSIGVMGDGEGGGNGGG